MPLGTLEVGWRPFFLGAISLGSVLPSLPKIMINLSRTYEKLNCKETDTDLFTFI